MLLSSTFALLGNLNDQQTFYIERQEKEALELLEFTQTLLSSPTIKSDIEAQDIKQAIRNNLATYAYAYTDSKTAKKLSLFQ